VPLSIKGGEVSGQVLASSPRLAEYLGVPIAQLYGPFRHFIEAPPKRLDWDDYVTLKEITEQLAGSDERMVVLGNKIIETPSLAAGARALALFVDPGLVILKASKNGWGSLYSNVDIECTKEADKIRVDLRLHEGYKPCRAFFVQNAGILEHAPNLIGAGTAHVEWETDGYSGTYLVTPPPSNTMWSRVKRWINVVMNTRATMAELAGQQVRLNDQNRELHAALRNAHLALQTRDRFFQTIDHELRTPLNGIRGALREMQATPRIGEDAKLIDLIDRSEARLGDLITSILEYTRLGSENIVARPRDFRPCALAQSLKSFAQQRAKTVQLEVVCTVPPGQWVSCDDEHLDRISKELLSNALRFAGHAPIRVSIGLAGEGLDRRLDIQVCDRGPGIAADDHARIFEPFVQLHGGEARDFDGTGLGLAIVAARAKALGGALSLDSKLGQGSTFSLSIPVAHSDRVGEPVVQSTSVLLVDDNKVNLMIAARLLKRLGCRVTMAEDGFDALERFQASRFDLVLMDCEMPNLDGWATTRRLRDELHAETPVIAFTAYTSQVDRQRCVDSGMDDFLPKPVSEAALEAILQRWASSGRPLSAANDC
jgi:signal transduction histidine kinase/CheY-like chemotaxis protein